MFWTLKGSLHYSGIWSKLELIQAYMYVVVFSKYEKDPIKVEKTRRHHFPHFKSMEIFSDNSLF